MPRGAAPGQSVPQELNLGEICTRFTPYAARTQRLPWGRGQSDKGVLKLTHLFSCRFRGFSANDRCRTATPTGTPHVERGPKGGAAGSPAPAFNPPDPSHAPRGRAVGVSVIAGSWSGQRCPRRSWRCSGRPSEPAGGLMHSWGSSSRPETEPTPHPVWEGVLDLSRVRCRETTATWKSCSWATTSAGRRRPRR